MSYEDLKRAQEYDKMGLHHNADSLDKVVMSQVNSEYSTDKGYVDDSVVQEVDQAIRQRAAELNEKFHEYAFTTHSGQQESFVTVMTHKAHKPNNPDDYWYSIGIHAHQDIQDNPYDDSYDAERQALQQAFGEFQQKYPHSVFLYLEELGAKPLDY
jgi:hypothetical protein